MKNPNRSSILIGDFETTVYEGQTHTEVWASALVPLYSEDVKIFNSIEDTWEYIVSMRKNLIIYYHNLKFDGLFWLSYFFGKLNYKQAYVGFDEFIDTYDTASPADSPVQMKNNDMPNNSVKYMISDMGQWYSITVKVRGHYIEFRDSYKLLPFSVRAIGKSFKTKHQKLDMEYVGYRYAGCTITEEEQKYIANDVFVVKEALEIMITQGHNKLTIGSCCMEEFRKTQMDLFDTRFPNIYNDEIDESKYGSPNMGEYVRKAYRGGWTYLVKGKEKRLFNKGLTADVNSLYPSMMHSESGNRYPVGHGHMWKGNFIPSKIRSDKFYFFVRIKTRFYIKKDKLPFVQIKGNMLYRPTEILESSDFKFNGESYTHYMDTVGVKHDTRVTMTLTVTDFILLQEHYELVDFEILDGCWFYTEDKIFDAYINKWRDIKVSSTGAMRQLAKLFLNNLYGKMATSKNSSFKIGIITEDRSIGFLNAEQYDKKPGYIPVGAAITSYARNFTIRAAQKNYHGVDKPGFIYADTDSIHCDLSPDELVGVPVHPTAFCHWKIESCWDEGWFVRAKTYIEHVTEEDCTPIDKPFYNIKCAGMPERSKNLFLSSMTGIAPADSEKYDEEELSFTKTKREITDFKEGLVVPGKLMPKRIEGGIILVSTNYEMRNYIR